MTIQKAIEWQKVFKRTYKSTPSDVDDACDMAISALEKQIPKKPICVPKQYTEELGFNDEFLCPICRSYVGYFTEGMIEPEQMEYCNACGQHIAKDWSDED